MTEEKLYWNFCLRLSLAEVRLSVLGMCITEAVRARVAEFDVLTEILDSGCQTCSFFDFHLNAFFITLCPKLDISM